MAIDVSDLSHTLILSKPLQRTAKIGFKVLVVLCCAPTDASHWCNCQPPSANSVGALAAWGGGGPALVWEDAWDTPCPRFEGFVEDCVRRRLGKYRQPAHPMHLSMDEAAALFKKVRRVIVDTERKVRAPSTFRHVFIENTAYGHPAYNFDDLLLRDHTDVVCTVQPTRGVCLDRKSSSVNRVVRTA